MFPNTPTTLLKTISDFAEGDDHAEWEAFVELYTPPLRRFVERVSPSLSKTDLEDAVQDVFVRLVAVLREGRIDRRKAKFRAYLATMTRRILIDRYRVALAHPRMFEANDGQKSVAIGGIDPGAAVDVIWRIAVRDAAKSHVLTKTAISEQSKRIYGLLEDGKSLREAAVEMGVTYDVVKQVKSRIDRAIAAIERRQLEDDAAVQL